MNNTKFFISLFNLCLGLSIFFMIMMIGLQVLNFGFLIARSSQMKKLNQTRIGYPFNSYTNYKHNFAFSSSQIFCALFIILLPFLSGFLLLSNYGKGAVSSVQEYKNYILFGFDLAFAILYILICILSCFITYKKNKVSLQVINSIKMPNNDWIQTLAITTNSDDKNANRYLKILNFQIKHYKKQYLKAKNEYDKKTILIFFYDFIFIFAKRNINFNVPFFANYLEIKANGEKLNLSSYDIDQIFMLFYRLFELEIQNK